MLHSKVSGQAGCLKATLPLIASPKSSHVPVKHYQVRVNETSLQKSYFMACCCITKGHQNCFKALCHACCGAPPLDSTVRLVTLPLCFPPMQLLLQLNQRASKIPRFSCLQGSSRGSSTLMTAGPCLHLCCKKL